MAIASTISVIGVYIPFFLIRLCRRHWDGWSWVGKTLFYLVASSFALTLAYNLQTARDLTISELSPFQLLGVGVMGCSLAVYFPLVFLQVYQESWHEWPWQTKTYFMCGAFGLPFMYLWLTYDALTQ